MGFPGGEVVKNPPANAGDARDALSIPGSGRSPGVGNPLQYNCLENVMDLAGYNPWGRKELETEQLNKKTNKMLRLLKRQQKG